MRKTTTGILICILVFSVIPVTSSIKTPNNTRTEATAEMNYSHTVFVELGSYTGCHNCKNASAALKNIYANGWFPFYYVSLLTQNDLAKKRIYTDYNCLGFPDVFFDGGYNVTLGANDIKSTQDAYNASIIKCEKREVPDLDIMLSVDWIKNATMNIDVTVHNNETSDYNGHIRVYITEKSSSLWYDTGGHPYMFAFLDYAFNEAVHIAPNGTWQNSTLWNGNEHNFGFITCNNIMVIAAVFNSTWHQGYANPPSYRPFQAYYVDQTTATSPHVQSNPPTTPTITGPQRGKVEEAYTYTAHTTDPDGDQLYYWFNWGDDTSSGWVGPYDSGATASASHIWTISNVYDIRVKAKNTHDVGSDLSEPLTNIMPKNSAINMPFLRFPEQHPRFFLLIQQLLGL